MPRDPQLEKANTFWENYGNLPTDEARLEYWKSLDEDRQSELYRLWEDVQRLHPLGCEAHRGGRCWTCANVEDTAKTYGFKRSSVVPAGAPERAVPGTAEEELLVGILELPAGYSVEFNELYVTRLENGTYAVNASAHERKLTEIDDMLACYKEHKTAAAAMAHFLKLRHLLKAGFDYETEKR